MSTMLIQSGTLQDIADSIRTKTGGSNNMTPLEMPNEIANIPSGSSSNIDVMDCVIASVRGSVKSESYTIVDSGLYMLLACYTFAGSASITIPNDRTPIVDLHDRHSATYSGGTYYRGVICKIVELQAGDSVSISATDGSAGSSRWYGFGYRICKLNKVTISSVNAHTLVDDVQGYSYNPSSLTGNHYIICVACGSQWSYATVSASNCINKIADFGAYSVMAIVKGEGSSLSTITLTGYNGGLVEIIDCIYS